MTTRLQVGRKGSINTESAAIINPKNLPVADMILTLAVEVWFLEIVTNHNSCELLQASARQDVAIQIASSCSFCVFSLPASPGVSSVKRTLLMGVIPPHKHTGICLHFFIVHGKKMLPQLVSSRHISPALVLYRLRLKKQKHYKMSLAGIEPSFSNRHFGVSTD